VYTHLHSQGSNDALGMHQRLIAQVVQATLGEDLGASLEPDGLAKLHAGVLGQQLRGQHAQSTQQSPAGVDQLNLPVAGERLAAGKEESHSNSKGLACGVLHSGTAVPQHLREHYICSKFDTCAVDSLQYSRENALKQTLISLFPSPHPTCL